MVTYPCPGIVVSTTVGAFRFEFSARLDAFDTLSGIMRASTIPAASRTITLPGSVTPLATMEADLCWFLIWCHCLDPKIPKLGGMGHFSSVESNAEECS